MVPLIFILLYYYALQLSHHSPLKWLLVRRLGRDDEDFDVEVRIFARMNWEIFEAAASGNVDYLRKSADPKLDLDQALSPQKNTVLHIAVSSKQKEFAKQVIELCPSLLFKANKKGDSPLHVAASTGCLELVELLISSAKLPGKDVENQGHHVENAVEDLLRMANELKETAMHIGLRKGHVDVVRSLMEADIGLLDLVTSADESPLYLAVLGRFTDLVILILETRPSSPCGGPKGMNAWHAAVDKFQNYGIMKILAEKRKGSIKEADMIGWTPLHYAAYCADLQAVQLLLKFDSSAAYLSDKDGICPLHIAAFRGKVDIARELIKCCPYIWESPDEKGRTVLHAAVIGGKQKLVEYILEVPDLACRLINEPDKDGNTPLHMAVVCGNHRIISILARHEGVDKIAMNKDLFMAADIFLSKQEMSLFEYEKMRHLLERLGLPFTQRWADTKYRKKLKGDHLIIKEEEKEEKEEEGFVDLSRSMFQTHFLVAVLIATVTFAAVFTMPGGYKDEGPDQGMPNLIEKVGFKAFVIFDTLAFTSSATAVTLMCYCSGGSYLKFRYMANMAVFFIFMAMIGMVLTFLTAMYLLLSKSTGLVITVFVMEGCFIIALCVLWFLDPRGNLFRINRASRYLRNILFDHGIL